MVDLKTLYKKLPPAKVNDKKTMDNQTTSDIINQVLLQHKLNRADAKKIAHYFDTGNAYSTCQAIWDFLKYKVKYSIEPSSYQSTKTLSRFIYDALHNTGKNDCKHFAGFTGAILDALGYNFAYRFAGYSKYHKYPTHVYVVCYDSIGNEIIIDAVINGFDLEKPYTIKIDKNMALYQLSGLEDAEVGGILSKAKNAVKKAATGVKQAAKSVAKPVVQAAKAVKQGALTVSLAIPRNAFLLLVRFNVHGWATGLNKMSWDKLKWWSEWFGGNRTDLQNAIKAGAKNKRILGINYNDYLVPESVGAIGVEPVTVTAALASATPIIVKVADVLKEAEKISDTVNKVTTTVNKTQDAINKGNAAFKSLTGKSVSDVIFKKDSGKTADTSQLTAGDFSTPTDSEAMAVANSVAKSKPMDNKNLLLIGGGALALIFLLKKK